MFSANSFYAFTQAFCIWYNYVASFVDGVSTLAAFFWIIWSTDFVLNPVPAKPMLDIYIWSGCFGDFLFFL